MGSANLGTLYNLCFSFLTFFRIYIHNIVYIIGFVNILNLCFGFDLAWFGKLVQAQCFPVCWGNTLLCVANVPWERSGE